jgi:hypothetical protein
MKDIYTISAPLATLRRERFQTLIYQRSRHISLGSIVVTTVVIWKDTVYMYRLWYREKVKEYDSRCIQESYVHCALSA